MSQICCQIEAQKGSSDSDTGHQSCCLFLTVKVAEQFDPIAESALDCKEACEQESMAHLQLWRPGAVNQWPGSLPIAEGSAVKWVCQCRNWVNWLTQHSDDNLSRLNNFPRRRMVGELHVRVRVQTSSFLQFASNFEVQIRNKHQGNDEEDEGWKEDYQFGAFVGLVES